MKRFRIKNTFGIVKNKLKKCSRKLIRDLMKIEENFNVKDKKD